MPSSQDLFGELDEAEDYLKILYYGQEGSAKSSNALSMANLGRVLLINAEGGAKKSSLRRRGVNTANIAIWPQDASKTPITAGGLDALYRRVKADLAADPKAWVGVVFDSGSDLVQALVDQVQKDRVRKSRNKGMTIDEVDSYFTDQADWGTMGKMLTDTIRKFRDLPTHVVWTALERKNVDKITSEIEIGPAVNAGVAVSLLGYADFVIHCSAGDEDRPFRGLTRKRGKFRAKDRFDVLPTVMAEPTVERVLAYSMGELTAENDPLQKGISQALPGKKSGKKDDKSETKIEEEADTDAETE